MEFKDGMKPQTDEHYRIVEWVKEGNCKGCFDFEVVNSAQMKTRDSDGDVYLVTCAKSGSIDVELVGHYKTNFRFEKQLFRTVKNCKGIK